MNPNPATAVAFTGHRTYCGEAAAALQRAVETLYAEGCRTFLSGMAAGFDMAAAETVLACRDRLSGLRLVAVVPFEGHINRFSNSDSERFGRIVARGRDDGAVDPIPPGRLHAAQRITW